MPTAFAFRLSMYLTMGLSCLCLGYAEFDFLPSASFFAGIVILLLIVSFFLEGRFELTLRSANQLGLAIGILATIWMIIQFVRKDSLIYTFPWPASLLPYLGPLLMILMPAKLFRPKHMGDWWTMQGLALATTGLATAMAEDAIFGILLGCYGLSVVWSLTIFYFRRSAGLLPPINPSSDLPVPIVVSPAHYVGRVLLSHSVLWQSTGRLAIALVLSLPLFFLSPRSEAPRWQFSKIGIETGLGDGQIDLTRTGQMRVNRDVAFVVQANYPDGRPKEDLPLNDRWRAASFQGYSDGSWRFKTLEGKRFLFERQVLAAPARNAQDAFPPNLDPEQYVLDISIANVPKMLYRVVKDPVRWKPGMVAPIASFDSEGWLVWSQMLTLDGHFGSTGRPRRYRQVSYDTPSGDHELGQPFEVHPEVQNALFASEPDSPITTFRRFENLPRVREFTIDLLNKLAKQDGSIKKALERADSRRSLQFNPLDYEKVARALHHFLSTSPDFTYTMNLKRSDLTIDPVEDFLLKTKTGHCERYATALALMCRSVGVPAVYTIGYKGCEPGDSPGQYFIRQDAAHAWVEVFIPRPRTGPPPAGGENTPYVWHWLSLDPTPFVGEEPGSNTLSDWLGTAKESGIGFFLDFIIGYNPDRRVRTVKAVNDWFAHWWWTFPIVPFAVVILWTAQRAWSRRREANNPTVESASIGLVWFDEFRTLLQDHHLDLPPGLTWLEYAPKLAAVIPEAGDSIYRLTHAFYQARYAGETPTQTTDLHKDVDTIRGLLKALDTKEQKS
jgi:protein-glutamine gamma-glutamyltransferase